MTIHKRVIDSTLCGNRTWTLCEPEKVWTGPEKSYKNPAYVQWVLTNKHRWNDVTCEKCLARRHK